MSAAGGPRVTFDSGEGPLGCIAPALHHTITAGALCSMHSCQACTVVLLAPFLPSKLTLALPEALVEGAGGLAGADGQTGLVQLDGCSTQSDRHSQGWPVRKHATDTCLGRKPASSTGFRRQTEQCRKHSSSQVAHRSGWGGRSGSSPQTCSALQAVAGEVQSPTSLQSSVPRGQPSREGRQQKAGTRATTGQ